MRDFARLYTTLDETTATGEKVAALAEYFRTAPPADAAWAVHFLIGRRPKRWCRRPSSRPGPRRPRASRTGCSRRATPPSATSRRPSRLLLPDTGASDDRGLSYWVEQRLLPLRGQDEAAQREEMLRAWRELDRRERFVWNKLITGAFRVGVSERLVERALSLGTGVPEGAIAHRLIGGWEPTAEFFTRLCAPGRPRRRHEPALSVLPGLPAGELRSMALGPSSEWQAEWKWDGIRSQLIRRVGPDVPLVARRGAADRPVSRGRRAGRVAARRHRPRRRAPALGAASGRCRSRSCSVASVARP